MDTFACFGLQIFEHGARGFELDSDASANNASK